MLHPDRRIGMMPPCRWGHAITLVADAAGRPWTRWLEEMVPADWREREQ